MRYLFFLLLPLMGFSQREELHYFINKDTLIGVKNSKGEVIIPAEFDDARYRGLEDGQKIEENLIFLIFHKNKEVNPSKGVGFMYDRKGNFLFHPFWFDNGPDYFSEGLMRFVGDNNKVGFANTEGEIIIEPKHYFVSPFNYGYAEFCDGCRWECASKDDCEHHIMVGGTWGKINKKGEIIEPSDKPKSPDDIEIGGVFFPNPFIYNEKEQKIVDFFRNQEKKIAYLYYEQFTNAADIKDRKVFFEIVDRPREHFPFYEIYTYDHSQYTLKGQKISGIQRIDDLTFIISEDGKEVYHYNFWGEKTNFAQWEKKQKREVKERKKLTKKQENEHKNIHRKKGDF